MERIITISTLRASGVNTWSVRDNSVRGCATKNTTEVKLGDMVVIDNHFTLVVDDVK